MPELNFTLHDKQLEVVLSPAKFKVAAAGRRGGKSYLAAAMLLTEGMKMENAGGYNLATKDVWYIAPTFNQGKDIIWSLLKELGGMKENGGVIDSTVENVGIIRLINGRRILVKGSDRPDTLRGVGLSYVVMDEYADMKPEVWDLIIQPTLIDVDGDALFIGTPDGKNHFYELYKQGLDPEHEEWESFHWTSLENPVLNQDKIEARRKTMSIAAFRQEHEASFEASGGGIFDPNDIQIVRSREEWGDDGHFYVTMDPAGFGTGEGMIRSTMTRLDEHAIAAVEVGPKGWLVHEVVHGRWGVREACIRFLNMCRRYQPVAAGIESGALKNAMHDYLEDESRRLGVYPNMQPVNHGKQRKTERILWALQGRFQRGRIALLEGDWNKKFIEQLLDFPNPLAHDDLIDAVAYADQISQSIYLPDDYFEDQWQPLDEFSGF